MYMIKKAGEMGERERERLERDWRETGRERERDPEREWERVRKTEVEQQLEL